MGIFKFVFVRPRFSLWCHLLSQKNLTDTLFCGKKRLNVATLCCCSSFVRKAWLLSWGVSSVLFFFWWLVKIDSVNLLWEIKDLTRLLQACKLSSKWNCVSWEKLERGCTGMILVVQSLIGPSLLCVSCSSIKTIRFQQQWLDVPVYSETAFTLSRPHKNENLLLVWCWL